MDNKKFMIHFEGSVYSNELYCNEKGSYIFDLQKAIEEAETQFPKEKFEVYNGVEGFCNFED